MPAYNSKAFATECFADTASIEIVFQLTNKSLNKQHGISNVAKVMRARADVIKLGLVDGDRGRHTQNPYFRDFADIDAYDNLLRLKKHNQSDQFLIVVEPAIEHFLITAASEANLNVDDFPFTRNLDAMKDLCKDSEVYNKEEFRNFIRELRRQRPPCLVTLSSWIADKMNWQNPFP